MPRPKKCRRICCLPKSNLFGPLNTKYKEEKTITMAIDEYETIRLIDLEGMKQDECAEKMNVARTTIQRIYNDARFKIASSLVNGYILKIEGGDYKLCNDNEPLCKNCRCPKLNCCLIRNEDIIKKE